MPFPNCIIAGAQRSGTTSLYNWLMDHPGVWDAGEPRREVHFASYQHHWEQGPDWYAEQFTGAAGLVVEKSPVYLDHALAPARLHQVNPGAKIIFCLRNPVDRAWSHWRKARAKGFEPDKFGAALRLEPQRLQDEADEWGPAIWRDRYYLSCHHVRCYQRRGHYAEHLERWFKLWPREQVLIVKSEEMFAYPGMVYAAALDFLGLPHHTPERWSHYQRLGRNWQMAPRIRARLEAYFKPHNERLAELLEDENWKWEGDRNGQI